MANLVNHGLWIMTALAVALALFRVVTVNTELSDRPRDVLDFLLMALSMGVVVLLVVYHI